MKRKEMKMTRKQLAEAIFEIESEMFGYSQSSKKAHIDGMLNGCMFAKPMKKAELEQRLADLTA